MAPYNSPHVNDVVLLLRPRSCNVLLLRPRSRNVLLLRPRSRNVLLLRPRSRDVLLLRSYIPLLRLYNVLILRSYVVARVIPQALCSRYSLPIGYYLSP